MIYNDLEYRILRRIAPREPDRLSSKAYDARSKVEVLLGEDFLPLVRGKVVIDFGCGEGKEAVELARKGAARVIGIDIRDKMLERARNNAARAGLDSICEFVSTTDQLADLIICLDSFEHFRDPEAALNRIHDLLKPGGVVFICFGPTWYHPYGGHLFSVFPWAHLLFSEEALVRWRSGIRDDGARSFGDVDGGLNQMTIRRFERLVRNERFLLERLETVPIRKTALFHNRWTREFTSSLVRCKLGKRLFDDAKENQ